MCKKVKITAEYINSKGNWEVVRCPCCNAKRIFTSWREVEDYFKDGSVKTWKAMKLL